MERFRAGNNRGRGRGFPPVTGSRGCIRSGTRNENRQPPPLYQTPKPPRRFEPPSNYLGNAQAFQPMSALVPPPSTLFPIVGPQFPDPGRGYQQNAAPFELMFNQYGPSAEPPSYHHNTPPMGMSYQPNIPPIGIHQHNALPTGMPYQHNAPPIAVPYQQNRLTLMMPPRPNIPAVTTPSGWADRLEHDSWPMPPQPVRQPAGPSFPPSSYRPDGMPYYQLHVARPPANPIRVPFSAAEVVPLQNTTVHNVDFTNTHSQPYINPPARFDPSKIPDPLSLIRKFPSLVSRPDPEVFNSRQNFYLDPRLPPTSNFFVTYFPYPGVYPRRPQPELQNPTVEENADLAARNEHIDYHYSLVEKMLERHTLQFSWATSQEAGDLSYILKYWPQEEIQRAFATGLKSGRFGGHGRNLDAILNLLKKVKKVPSGELESAFIEAIKAKMLNPYLMGLILRIVAFGGISVSHQLCIRCGEMFRNKDNHPSACKIPRHLKSVTTLGPYDQIVRFYPCCGMLVYDERKPQVGLCISEHIAQ